LHIVRGCVPWVLAIRLQTTQADKTYKPSQRQNPDKETSREYTVYVPNVCVTYPNKGYNMCVDNLSCSCFNINFFCSKLNNSDKIMIIIAMPGKFDKK